MGLVNAVANAVRNKSDLAAQVDEHIDQAFRQSFEDIFGEGAVGTLEGQLVRISDDPDSMRTRPAIRFSLEGAEGYIVMSRGVWFIKQGVFGEARILEIHTNTRARGVREANLDALLVKIGDLFNVK